MQITGYQLMDRLEELKEQAKTLDGQFKGSLFRFEGEEKADPRQLMDAYARCERKMAAIQEAQAQYNLRVQVTVEGEAMTLHRAVRLGSVAGRLKNQWKTAAGEGQNVYFPGLHNAMARDKEHEYARRVVEVDECLRRSEEASRLAAAFKRAIRAGNATELNIELDPSVFED